MRSIHLNSNELGVLIEETFDEKLMQGQQVRPLQQGCP